MELINIKPLNAQIKDYNLLVKHNNLVQGKYSLEASEQKLLYKIFEEIQKRGYTTREVEMSFQDFYSQYKSVLKKNITKRDFKTLIESLQGKFAYIIKGDEYIRTQWYKIHGKVDLSSVKLIIDEDVFEYVQSLDRNFTGLRIESIYAFKSFYSMRIYELIKQWAETKTSLAYEVRVLKELLCVENNSSYNNFSNFKKYILDKAVKEINEKSELKIKAQGIKEGRTTKIVCFTILENTEKQNEILPIVSDEETASTSSVLPVIAPNSIKTAPVVESENFYIPDELRIDPRMKRLFGSQFKAYDFNDENNFMILLQAEESALVKDGKELITALNYPLFAKILRTKLDDFHFRKEQSHESFNEYEGLSLEEREVLFNNKLNSEIGFL